MISQNKTPNDQTFWEMAVGKIEETKTGKLTVVTTRTVTPEFASLEALVEYYQEHAFSDGTSLIRGGRAGALYVHLAK